MVKAISTLVGEELDGGDKYDGTVAAANGCVYGIPYCARRVIKFNPVDKSITEIGPDLGDGAKCCRGAITGSGVIYCIPDHSRRGILKIDTNTDDVTELDVNLLPERGQYMWLSCVLALDGCIYFIPGDARRIMKLDPNNNDAMTSVGDDLGDEPWKYRGACIGIDGCVYGIPYYSKCILKYDPINNITLFVGEEPDESFGSSGGALGRDGCIYAITRDGRVLKIDTTNNDHCFVGNSVESNHGGYGWSDAVLGIDGCIYWPPVYACRILKYDPHTNKTTLVGDDFGNTTNKWYGGSLASDGVIYCIPDNANRILSIDPWKEYSSSSENIIMQHPEQLGCIFNPSDDMPTETNFDRAVIKFGHKQVLKALEACMHPVDQVCTMSNLHPVMIAASLDRSDVSVIYHLLRQVPSLMNCINCT